MTYQSPLISIPKKSTEEVDWTNPIRVAISQSYGEDPENYMSECANLQRCRQDAVKGAGSDLTGRPNSVFFGGVYLVKLTQSQREISYTSILANWSYLNSVLQRSELPFHGETLSRINL